MGVWGYDDDFGAPAVHHEGELFAERIGDRVSLAFFDWGLRDAFAHQGPYDVKLGQVFVLGDNRFNSHDSRMWAGGRGAGVPLEAIRGVAFVIWLSVTQHEMDTSRIGQSIDEPHLPKSAAMLAPRSRDAWRSSRMRNGGRWPAGERSAARPTCLNNRPRTRCGNQGLSGA